MKKAKWKKVLGWSIVALMGSGFLLFVTAMSDPWWIGPLITAISVASVLLLSLALSLIIK